MSALVNRQWLLDTRPKGMLGPENFKWTQVAVPELGDGEVLVRNLYVSCDPTQRGWAATDTYLPRVKIGDVMRAFAVGEVIQSRDARVPQGKIVQGTFGWQDYCVTRADALGLPVAPEVSIETAMSALGVTGMTAYFGLLDVGKPNAGDTVVVSGAAGATGSVAGQIAKLKGCRTIGIAGGAEKCRYVKEELGFDDVVDYKSENPLVRLGQLCPKGINVFFDNVGGKILDAALAHLAIRGRVVLCGGISSYNEEEAPGPRNYLSLVVHRGRMEGFLILDYVSRFSEAQAALSGWLREGRLKDRVDVQHGLENAPAALARVFSGANQGKQLLKIADPSAARK